MKANVPFRVSNHLLSFALDKLYDNGLREIFSRGFIERLGPQSSFQRIEIAIMGAFQEVFLIRDIYKTLKGMTIAIDLDRVKLAEKTDPCSLRFYTRMKS